jgi:hypothetical protein
MISVETTNPVYSNANGVPKATKVRAGSRKDPRKAISEKQQARDLKKANRKAKRNAPKLKKVRRKSGKTSFVMKLIKLVPIQKMQKFSGGDSTITAVASPVTEYKKTFADGTSITIPASDVIVNTAGVFDKGDIARAFGVSKESLTPQMIDNYLVYIAPAPANSDVATETQKSATSDVAIEIPNDKVVETPDGTFLATDTQEDSEPTKDIAVEQKQEQAPLKKYEKVILWGGIGVIVLIIGVVAYRNFSKAK